LRQQVTRKADCADFRRIVTELKNRQDLPFARRWAKYLYRFDTIETIPEILRDDKLLSRNAAQTKRNIHDSADSNVIEQTNERWKDFVRLYFRPLTPTAYINEGFCGQAELERGAPHCPVPVYLLFDAKQILCRADSQFSNQNLARRNARAFTSAQDFARLPFEDIYHDGPMPEADKSRIKARRNAEVIVPEALELDALRYICCRSQAEYETLLALLPADVFDIWSRSIRVMPRLFYQHRFFIKQVFMDDQRIQVLFHFGRSTDDQTYNIGFELLDFADWRSHHIRINIVGKTGRSKPLTLSLDRIGNPEDYDLKIYVNDLLAYQNEYRYQDDHDDDLPF
jgi:hypothetical protein